MRTYMIKRGATYCFRRVVPEPLRPYLLTKSGDPRTEFTFSLQTKDRKEANERLERETIRISGYINEAQRKLDAGIAPGKSDEQAAAFERWEQERLAHEVKADLYFAEQQAETEAEDDEYIASLNRPFAELSARDRLARHNLPQELFDPPAVRAQREREALAAYEGAGREISEAFERSGVIGVSQAPYPRLMEIFDRYIEAAQVAPATVKAWRPVIKHLINFLGYDDASRANAEDFRRWRDFLLSEPTRAGTVRSDRTVRDTYISAAKAVYNYAIDEGAVSHNPVDKVKVRAVKKIIKRTNKGFYDQEAAIILKAASSVSVGEVSSNLPKRNAAR